MESLKKKKILILGAKGMLGNCIHSYLLKNKLIDVYGTSSSNIPGYIYFKIDSNYIENLNILLKDKQFDYVVNCIGFIRPDINNIEDYNNSLLVNSHFPKTLQKLSYQYNFKLIHFSTDCVFDGKIGNYSVDDIPNEFNIYGMSKYLGEIDDKINLTIRTSIIGVEVNYNSKNLLNWFLSQKDNSIINGYINVFWNGLTTLMLSKIVEEIIIKNINIFGIHQFGSDVISKYELLVIFKDIFNKNIHIVPKEVDYSNKVIVPSLEQKKFRISSIKDQISELKTFYNL